jgi:hypothetical protein
MKSVTVLLLALLLSDFAHATDSAAKPPPTPLPATACPDISGVFGPYKGPEGDFDELSIAQVLNPAGYTLLDVIYTDKIGKPSEPTITVKSDGIKAFVLKKHVKELGSDVSVYATTSCAVNATTGVNETLISLEGITDNGVTVAEAKTWFSKTASGDLSTTVTMSNIKKPKWTTPQTIIVAKK